MLELEKRGLLVSGETFPIKDFLRELGGKWDPTPLKKGWLFALAEGLPDTKRGLLAALRASTDVASVEDKALAKLSLVLCEKGFLVSGDTFLVKDFLKDQGGRWNALQRGWIFHSDETSSKPLIATLRGCGAVSVDTPAVAGKLALSDVPSEKPRKDLQAVGERMTAIKALADTGRTLAARGPATPQAITKKVVDTAKGTRMVKKGPNGTSAHTDTDRRERKILDRRTGKQVETTSVTKTRKVVETRDKVVETKTIVVKRTRKK